MARRKKALNVMATADQVAAWRRAAQADGRLLSSWVRSRLDRAAADEGEAPDEGSPYRGRSQLDAAGRRRKRF